MVIEVGELTDLLLLLITLRELGEIAGRTRLQKTVYLLRERFGVPFSLKFKPYYYGPYSDELSDIVENLVALALIEEHRRYLADGVVEYSYKLTDAGSRFLETQIGIETLRKPPLANLLRGLRELRELPTNILVAAAKSILTGLVVPSM
jgi:uncharacterized protein YwgA